MTRGGVRRLFAEAAEDIVAFSESKKDTLRRWSDIKPAAEGRSSDQCVGFITKQEPSDVLDIAMFVVIEQDSGDCNLRVSVIRVDEDGDGHERFNQVQIIFNLSHEIAKTEIEKADNFGPSDILNLLKSGVLIVHRVVLSDNTGRNEKTDKMLGKRYDYNFTAGTALISEDGESNEEKIPDNLDMVQLREIINVIMTRIKN